MGAVGRQGAWRTFPLRVIKSSWGIAIDLTARCTMSLDHPGQATQVGSRTWLDVSSASLEAIDIAQLVSGARRVADQIETARPDDDVTIEVRDVTYSLTDYQPDGVAAALVGWATEEFGLDYPPIAITFDRDANRYLFGW